MVQKWSAEGWLERDQWYRRSRQCGPRKEPDVPEGGFLYFFECVTGWFKAGRTGNWKARKAQYTGPQEPKKVFFVRAVKDMKKGEKLLLTFLDAHGYHRKKPKTNKTEWFTRAQCDSFSLVLAKP